jgi:hypothetical protein
MVSITGDGLEAALTQIQGTVTRPPMGRPSLNVKETKVRLTDEARQRIELLVGKNRMAEFIREAVENELNRREKPARKKDSAP